MDLHVWSALGSGARRAVRRTPSSDRSSGSSRRCGASSRTNWTRCTRRRRRMRRGRQWLASTSVQPECYTLNFLLCLLCVLNLYCVLQRGEHKCGFFVCFEIGKFLRAFFVCFFASCLCYVYKFGFASDLMIIIMIIRQKFSPLTGLFVEPWLHPERTTTHRWLSIRTVNVCGRGRAGGAAGHHQAGSGGAPPSRHTPYQQGGQCMGRSVMNNRNSNVSPPISPQGIFLFKYIHISSSPRLWTPPPGPTNQRTTHLPL